MLPAQAGVILAIVLREDKKRYAPRAGGGDPSSRGWGITRSLMLPAQAGVIPTTY